MVSRIIVGAALVMGVCLVSCNREKSGGQSTQNDIVAVQSLEEAPAKIHDPSLGSKLQGAQVLIQVNPIYPEKARNAGVEGVVNVDVSITVDGIVSEASVSDSGKGSPELQKAAIEAARKWTFIPAKFSGRPCASKISIPFKFKLEAKSFKDMPPADEKNLHQTVQDTRTKMAGAEDSVKVDEFPTPLTQVSPKYPEKAIKDSIQCKVWLKLLIGIDGKVHDLKIFQSNGCSPEIEKAAADAARLWTFRPAQYKGKPIELWAALPFVFRLK